MAVGVAGFDAADEVGDEIAEHVMTVNALAPAAFLRAAHGVLHPGSAVAAGRDPHAVEDALETDAELVRTRRTELPSSNGREVPDGAGSGRTADPRRISDRTDGRTVVAVRHPFPLLPTRPTRYARRA